MNELKVGDEVKIISKRLGVNLDDAIGRGHLKKGETYNIEKVYGNPYSGADEENCFIVCGDYFAPEDLLFVGSDKIMSGKKVMIDVPLNHMLVKYNGKVGIIDYVDIANKMVCVNFEIGTSLVFFNHEVVLV